MTTSPRVSLIVTTYQMPSHLARVLESVRQQTIASEIELIVSDDGSTDETAAVVQRFARTAPFPVRFVTRPHDGFQLSRCRNAGAAVATAPHLVFLDGDCLIPPDHVAQHLAAHRTGVVTNTYCVRVDEATSARITLDEVRSGAYLGMIPRKELRALAAINRKAWFYTWIGHHKKPALRGGNVGIARADYLRVNGYDENFRGWGCEDDDMGARLRAAGLRIEYILHRTRTFHLWHPPAVTKPNKMREGQNFNYLTRPIRLACCLRGVVGRMPRDLQVRVLGSGANVLAARRFLAARGLKAMPVVEPSAPGAFSKHADLELLCTGVSASFSRNADCRIFIADDATTATNLPRAARQAHIVLSSRGELGNEGQLRLRLDDPAALWQAIGWRAPEAASAAA